MSWENDQNKGMHNSERPTKTGIDSKKLRKIEERGGRKGQGFSFDKKKRNDGTATESEKKNQTKASAAGLDGRE